MTLIALAGRVTKNYMVIEIITRTYSSTADICEAYEKRGIQISWWAEDLIQKVHISDISESKRIKIISGRELGFVDKGLNTDIYKKALSSGMKIITAESSLILGCSGVKIDERIMSGMEPIRLTGGDPMVFTHWNKRFSASFALPDQMVWDSQIKWAFELSN